MSLDAMGIGSVADLLKTAVQTIWPDPEKKAAATVAILQAEQAGAFKAMDAELQQNIEQIKVNAIAEAKPGITFRDGAGWTCVAGLALSIFKSPLEWGFAISGHPITLPNVDPTVMIPLLLALLGVSGMHLYQQTK